MNRRSYPRVSGRILAGSAPVYVGALIILAVLLVLVRLIAPGALSYVATPIWKGGTHLSAAVSNTFSLQSRASMLSERDALTRENAMLVSENAILSARVEDLTNLLGSRTDPAPGILASVLARPPVAPYDVLIVDQGTTSGVRMGARAYGAGGTPLGVVAEAGNRIARIALYSASGTEIEGWVGTGRLPITITGAGGGAVSASVPKDAGIAVGDNVFVAGSASAPIGTIVAVETDPSSPTVVLHMRPYANPFSLTWVTIEAVP